MSGARRMPPASPELAFYAEERPRLVAAELGDEARVKDGVFGAKMDVELVNDGPVTLVVDSPPRDREPEAQPAGDEGQVVHELRRHFRLVVGEDVDDGLRHAAEGGVECAGSVEVAAVAKRVYT